MPLNYTSKCNFTCGACIAAQGLQVCLLPFTILPALPTPLSFCRRYRPLPPPPRLLPPALALAGPLASAPQCHLPASALPCRPAQQQNPPQCLRAEQDSADGAAGLAPRWYCGVLTADSRPGSGLQATQMRSNTPSPWSACQVLKPHVSAWQPAPPNGVPWQCCTQAPHPSGKPHPPFCPNQPRWSAMRWRLSQPGHSTITTPDS